MNSREEEKGKENSEREKDSRMETIVESERYVMKEEFAV